MTRSKTGKPSCSTLASMWNLFKTTFFSFLNQVSPKLTFLLASTLLTKLASAKECLKLVTSWPKSKLPSKPIFSISSLSTFIVSPWYLNSSTPACVARIPTELPPSVLAARLKSKWRSPRTLTSMTRLLPFCFPTIVLFDCMAYKLPVY